MRLHFKKGSVVALGLSCGCSLGTIGKVVEVNDSEVILIQQAYVSATEHDKLCGVSEDKFNHNMSVDVGTPVHVNREFIATWQYYPVPNDPCTTHFNGVLNPSELDEVHPSSINFYDEDDCCKGKGDYLE